MRASNAIYDIEEGRPIWKTLPVRVGLTVALMVLTAVSAVAVTVTGGLAKEAGNLLGLGDTAVTVWNIAKWPVLLLFVSFMFAVLYWAAPNVKQPGFRWISPGGVLAVIGWVLASAAFAFYVGNFGSYNKTYGALAGVVVFLVWLWISNIMILLGAEFNAELERRPGSRRGSPRGQGAVPGAARHAQDGKEPSWGSRPAREGGRGVHGLRAGERPPLGSYVLSPGCSTPASRPASSPPAARPRAARAHRPATSP